MADKQSREDNQVLLTTTLLKALERTCEIVETFNNMEKTKQKTIREFDELEEKVKNLGKTNLMTSQEDKGRLSVGNIKVNIDCSEAIKGLKAIQREARGATATLKELEEQQKKAPGVVRVKSRKCPRCNGERFESVILRELSSYNLINEETKCLDCGWTE